MATVHHPAWPEITREVDDPARWEAAGWVRSDQPEPEPEPDYDL